MPKRLFAAIKITPDRPFLDKIHALESSLTYEKIKWVEDHNIHITLKFFGETEDKLIPKICEALNKIASETDCFSFSLQNLGIFGSKYDPRVVWVGIEPYDQLVGLMKRVHQEMIPIGFEPDRQNLVPHLTLGRVKFLKDKMLFQKTIDTYKTIASAPLLADKIILFESILQQEGPVYKVVQAFPMMR